MPSAVPASAAEIVTASGRRQLVILADSLVVGGAERVLQALAEDLPGEGFSVRVGCLRSAGRVGEELRAAGVPVDEGMVRALRCCQRPWLQLLRVGTVLIEMALFMLAVRFLPLADAHAILAAAPLIVTALALPL